MSQNKTVIPGLEQNDYQQQGGYAPSFNPQGGAASQSGFYQRNGAKPKHSGTVVPGMESGQPQQAINPQGGAQPSGFAQQQASRNSGKPVVGFLYSVSRVPQGEYWPLYKGRNIIGQSEDCDIVLPEGTVSGNHAILLVRQNTNPEKVIASLQDSSSTNGTMLNGISLEFTPVPCKSGDIITVGYNYELYLILVDTASLGLKVKEDFIHIKKEQPANDFPNQQFAPSMNDRPTRAGIEGNSPYAQGGPSPYNSSGYVANNGTVGLDGSISYNEKGGTVGY